MRPGDYQTPTQAKSYQYERFSGGLSIVHLDEMTILNGWLKKLPKNQNFLDVATGTGRVISLLLKYDPKIVFALDQSNAMLNQLAKIYTKPIKNGLVKTIQGNAQDINIKPSSIDVVVSLHLFKHIDNPRPIFNSIYKALKPGGLFIFDTLNKQSLVNLNLDSCFVYQASEINQLLKKAGFKIIEVKYLHLFGETIYNLVDIGPIDKLANKIIPGFATKMVFLAQKNDKS